MIRELTWQGSRKIITEMPAPPVSRFQARMALRQAGLFDAAEAACVAAGGDALLAWNEALEWRRDSPMVAYLAGNLGLSSAEVDSLFMTAGSIAV